MVETIEIVPVECPSVTLQCTCMPSEGHVFPGPSCTPIPQTYPPCFLISHHPEAAFLLGIAPLRGTSLMSPSPMYAWVLLHSQVLGPLLRVLWEWLTLPTLAVYLFYTALCILLPEFLGFAESQKLSSGFTLFPFPPFPIHISFFPLSYFQGASLPTSLWLPSTSL